MMYPQYSNSDKCGGSYTLHGHGAVCEWIITHEGDHVVARIYGDYRYEGKSYIFPKRIDALEALSDMIYAEAV